MAFSQNQTTDIESAMEDFMAKRRPPEKIRDQLDFSWRIEGQSVVIFSVRPSWKDASRKIEGAVAKAVWVRKSNRWNIFWQRADMRWHSYAPHPEAVFFDEFLAVVDEDANGCFWG